MIEGFQYVDLSSILKINYIPSLFTIIFMLILINGINFLDGIDGLLIGVSLIVLASFIILFKLIEVNSFNLSPIIVLIGSLCAFFIYNKYPAKVFLGDSGSLLMGWTFAIISFYFVKLSYCEVNFLD